jgi:hypothetical protein
MTAVARVVWPIRSAEGMKVRRSRAGIPVLACAGRIGYDGGCPGSQASAVHDLGAGSLRRDVGSRRGSLLHADFRAAADGGHPSGCGQDPSACGRWSPPAELVGYEGRMLPDVHVAALRARSATESSSDVFGNPSSESRNYQQNQALTAMPPTDLASNLAPTLQDHPGLEKLVESWPPQARPLGHPTYRGIVAMTVCQFENRRSAAGHPRMTPMPVMPP